MINNRQGGRRRGRGGQRTQGQGQSGQPGNRQDNRQRGNAAQLLEKYKSMARDSQLAGDRVQTEYYLQFADHYFRVLGESRSRFEDQRRQRGDDDLDDDDGDDDGDGAETESDGQDPQDDHSDRSPSRERRPRFEPDERPRQRTEADERPRQRTERIEADERPRQRTERIEADERPRQRTERRDEDQPESRDERPVRRKRVNGGDALPLSALPPAIGRVGDGDEAPAPASDEPAKPRRRARTVRPADSDDGVNPVG